MAMSSTGLSDVTTYGQYCPISRALEVLGDRWALLIVRDLLCGTTRFNDLARGLPDLSRTLLSKRLRQLVRAGVVEHSDAHYVLTESGRDLEPVVFGLGRWGARWAFDDPRPEELDPELLVGWMHRRLDTSGMPGVRHVVKVEFVDDLHLYWIVIERGTPSVCAADPGYPVDLTIRGTVADTYRVWLGRVPAASAVRQGLIQVDGARCWIRELSRILQLSPAAPLVAAASGTP